MPPAATNESVPSLDESNDSSEIAQGDKQSNVILPRTSNQNIAISIACNRQLISLSDDPGGAKQGTSFDADIVFSSATLAAAASTSTGGTNNDDAPPHCGPDGTPLEDYDYPTLHDLYEELLRSGIENQSRLDAVRELLCSRRRKQLAEDAEMLARTNRLNDKNVAIIKDLWNPKGLGQLDFLDLDRKEVANIVDLMNWKASDERKEMNESDRLKIDLRFREKGIEIKEERVKQTAALEGGNITLEGGEKGWVANLGETAVPHVTRGIMLTRYAPEDDAGYVEKERVVRVKGTDVIASTTSHRMDRFGNVCLNTATEIMFQHTDYYTAMEEGRSLEWMSANTQAAHDAVALVDHNMIVLHKGEGVGEFGMPDEKKLLKQRIEYAEQNGMTEDITLSNGQKFMRGELCQFRSLAHLVFNVLIVWDPITNEKAAIMSVGPQSRAEFQSKGKKAFETPFALYVGSKYHPQSENQVLVKIEKLVIESDKVASAFLSWIYQRQMIYRYGLNRLMKEYASPEERAAIADLVGSTGKGYGEIHNLINAHRDSNAEAEFKTNLEIFYEIKDTFDGNKDIPNGSIRGYEKILKRREEVDEIKKQVEQHSPGCTGVLAKQRAFDAIKDQLPDTISEEAKNMYRNFLAFEAAGEKQRQEVKLLSAELAKAKKDSQDGTVDMNDFESKMRIEHPDISDGAYQFLAGAEKQREEVKLLSAELAKAKKDSHDGTVDMNDFESKMRAMNPDISDAAYQFLAGAEKQREEVKQLSVELAKAKKDSRDGTVDMNEFESKMRITHPDISDGAYQFLAAGEKQRRDTKKAYAALALAKADQREGEKLDMNEFESKMMAANPEISGGVRFVAGRERHKRDVVKAYASLAAAKAAVPDGKVFEFNEFAKANNNVISTGALNFLAARKNTKTKSKIQSRLGYLLTSAQKHCKEINVEVTELKFGDYECLDCRDKPQYSEEHYVPNVDYGVEKGAYEAKCFCCGKMQNLLNERGLSYSHNNAANCRLVFKRKRSFAEYLEQYDNMKKDQKKAKAKTKKRKNAASENWEFTVDAPKGTLGIILRNRTDSSGTVVDEVLPTSVLVKQVSPGDRIIRIDDVDVSQMSVKEIIEVMIRKSAFEKELTLLAAPNKTKTKK